MPFWVRVEVPITPSRPTSQPAAVVTRNSAPLKGLPVALSLFWMINLPLGWFFMVTVTVLPALIWMVCAWVSLMNPGGAVTSVTITVLSGFKPSMRTYSDR